VREGEDLMFGWFAPKCPLNTWQKTWTESRMRWLASQFGIERLLQATVIEPTDQHFPGEYRRSKGDAELFLRRVCDWMQLDSARIQLEIVPDENLPGAVGRYQFREGQPSLIEVAQSQLAEPECLVATLAHELAHELLLGSGRLSADANDHERVTDLLPVFLGLGLFAANSAMYTETVGRWHMSRSQGYLQPEQFGYALALFAYLRGEREPNWGKHMTHHYYPSFKAGLRFLFKTNDSLFQPDTAGQEPKPLTAQAAKVVLEKGSPSTRLALLWDLSMASVLAPELAPGVLGCFVDGDAFLAREAARLLPRFGAAAADAVPVLLDTLMTGNSDRRAHAAFALGELRLQPDKVIPALIELLANKDDSVLQTAALALSQFGPAAQVATPVLLDRLPEPLNMDDDDTVEALLRAVLSITRNPEERIREHFSYDSEMCQLALEALAEYREYSRNG
jgi:hypothetical protein